MFSVSEIQKAQQVSSLSVFKAWWDIFLDYLVAATALNVLLLLTRMASVDTGGLVCVNPFENLSFGYVESRYINSRCCSSSDAWIIIFHPYLMLFMWMCITSIHVCWIKIPSINSKMEAFYAILYKIFTTQPRFYRNPDLLRLTSELSYSEANQKALDVLLNKLMYLMTERPFLRGWYIAKHSIVMSFCVLSVSLTFFSIAFLSKYPTSFNCYLKHLPPRMRGYPFQNNTSIAIPCHLNIAPFVYVLIHVDCFIRIVMIGLSIRGLIWASYEQNKVKFRFKHIFNPQQRNMGNGSRREKPESENVFGEASEYLSGMPSYSDLLFCMKLLKRNAHDGHLMYEAICISIKNYVKKLKIAGETYLNNQNAETERVRGISKRGQEKNGDKSVRFYHEYVVYVRWMAFELGLEEVTNSLGCNNLFEALLFIRSSLGLIDLDRKSDIRGIILDHMRSHPELYKLMIDEDPDSENYETYLENLSKLETFGSHFEIQAAATLFNVKFVIIHCEYIIKKPEIFIPLRHNLLLTGNILSATQAQPLTNTQEDISTKFITFIAPHFYHATVDMPVTTDWPHIVSRRLKFSTDRKYRWRLRQDAIRSVVLEDQVSPSSHKEGQI